MKNPNKDFLVYLAIAIFLVAGIVVSGEFTDADPRTLVGPVSLVVFTLVLFGYLIKFHWRLRRRTGFWVLIATCLILHVGLLLFITIKMNSSSPLLVFGILLPIEFIVFSLLTLFLFKADEAHDS
jgi:hypothetical protein